MTLSSIKKCFLGQGNFYNLIANYTCQQLVCFKYNLKIFQWMHYCSYETILSINILMSINKTHQRTKIRSI